MRLAGLQDRDAINAALQHPAIAPKLRHDARDPGYIDHPQVRYVGAWTDCFAGVFIAIDVTPWEVEAHVALLPHAVREARALAKLFIARELERPELQRITAKVMATLPSAANFCRKLGFVDEGVMRAACRIDGAPVDVLVLGLLNHIRSASSPSK